MCEFFKDLKNGTSYSVKFLDDDSVCKTLSVKGIKIRKIFAPVLRAIYTTQTDYKVIVEKKSICQGREWGEYLCLIIDKVMIL